MLNNRGVSFVETLLIVGIIFTLTGSLIPFMAKLNESLFVRKLDLHVSQVAYNAAKQIAHLGNSSGSEIIDLIHYQWIYDGQKLCVNYVLTDEEEMKCFSQEGVL